jgi:opacity protein-like surface antigen
MKRRLLLFVGAALLIGSGTAAAQVRGFADLGVTTFAATHSFDAILGTHTGPVFGGGVDVRLHDGFFVMLRASRFSKDGHRVFIFDGTTFDLNVDTTVTVIPVEASVGYRFRTRGPIVPYAAGGIGFHRYKETSAFASDTEDVNDTVTGFQALGGAEFRVHRLVAVAGEAEWARVPNAFGSDANGVAAAFDEHDLGGFSVRAKVVIGR